MSNTKSFATRSARGIRLEPHAKINLGLIIKGRRADGYHLLETLLVPVTDLRDEMEITPGDEPECKLNLEGKPLDGNPEDNLCVQAWKALAKEVPNLPGIEITLRKKIPAGAGLGGGSSDAAFTLRGINQLFDLGLTHEQLIPVAAKLGADVPFFLFDQPMLAQGIGTELEPFMLDLPFEIRLVTPGIHSSTIAAYKALDITHLDPSRSLVRVLSLPPDEWSQHLENDLEAPVFAKYPDLPAIKARFYQEGAIYAAMSGSGSAIFGLFPR